MFFFPRRYESVLPELFGGPGEAAGPLPAGRREDDVPFRRHQTWEAGGGVVSILYN